MCLDDEGAVADVLRDALRSTSTSRLLSRQRWDGARYMQWHLQTGTCGQTGAYGVLSMSTKLPNSDDKKHWESVHVCPKCEHILNLAQINLKTITTGSQCGRRSQNLEERITL